jgi:serine/threonine protein kinase
LSWESTIHDFGLRIIKPLAGGSYRKVYLCQNNIGQELVIKCYNEAKESSDKLPLPSDVEKERQLGYLVGNSPYFISFGNFYQTNGFVFSVWHYVDSSLADYIKSKGFISREDSLRMMLNPARGIDNFHTGKYGEVVVHGDLNPSGLFVFDNSIIKIGDPAYSEIINNETDHRDTQRSSHYSLPRHESKTTPDRDKYGFILTYAEMRLGRHPSIPDGGNEHEIVPNLINGNFFLDPLDPDEQQMILEGLSEEGWSNSLEKWISCLEREKTQKTLIPPGDILDAIAEKLELKPEEIRYNDYAKITELSLSSNYSLTDLTSLAKLTNLSILNLGGCKYITDLTPLTKLTRLTVLNLDWCKYMTCIIPLLSLKNLTTVSCKRSGIPTDEKQKLEQHLKAIRNKLENK